MPASTQVPHHVNKHIWMLVSMSFESIRRGKQLIPCLSCFSIPTLRGAILALHLLAGWHQANYLTSLCTPVSLFLIRRQLSPCLRNKCTYICNLAYCLAHRRYKKCSLFHWGEEIRGILGNIIHRYSSLDLTSVCVDISILDSQDPRCNGGSYHLIFYHCRGVIPPRQIY